MVPKDGSSWQGDPTLAQPALAARVVSVVMSNVGLAGWTLGRGPIPSPLLIIELRSRLREPPCGSAHRRSKSTFGEVIWQRFGIYAHGRKI
jgi:hypothetical protein